MQKSSLRPPVWARIGAAALAMLFLGVPVDAATPPSMDDALAQIAAYAPQALSEQGAPGMSVAITDRTHTLRIITAGYANLESKTPVTAQTRFPIGSITKGMTAAALMELRDAGKFDPAKPVRAYLPWWNIASGGATIYAHQSALAHRRRSGRFHVCARLSVQCCIAAQRAYDLHAGNAVVVLQ